MNRSESIKELASSLVKFHSKVSSISKDAKNPQFRSEYATLDKLILSTRHILQECGLSIMQTPLTKETGEIGIQTMLIHESGEFIETEPIFMTPTRMVKGGGYEIAKDPQAAGSTISYLRRYSYQAILNLNTGEDDDAERTSNPNYNENNHVSNNYNNNQRASSGTLTDKQLSRLFAIAKSKNVNNDAIAKMLHEYGVTDVKNLTKPQYDELCSKLESGDIPVSQSQLDSIKTLMIAKGVDKAKMQSIVKEIVGAVKSASNLSSVEATNVINHLLSLQDIA